MCRVSNRFLMFLEMVVSRFPLRGSFWTKSPFSAFTMLGRLNAWSNVVMTDTQYNSVVFPPGQAPDKLEAEASLGAQ